MSKSAVQPSDGTAYREMISWAHLAHRLVGWSMLISLIVKLPFFMVSYKLNSALQLEDGFFPGWLSSASIYLASYLGLLVLLLAGVVIPPEKQVLSKGVLAGLFYVLCIHQGTYNDVTFLTGFWVALWSWWLSWQLHRHYYEDLAQRGTQLGLLVLSLIFLGGAVGKLTPGYWNGEVLYRIYFAARPYWLFEFLRQHLSPESLRECAVWHSRFVIGMELLCSTLWLWPPRVGATMALVTLFCIAFLNNLALFSVVASLMGLALVGLWLPPTSRASLQPRPPGP